jgi:translation initiation factor eIF-2B subunit epsilon
LQKQDKGAVMTVVYKEAGHGHCSRCVEDEAVLAVDSSTDRVLVHHKMKIGTKRINIPLVLLVYVIRTLENLPLT